MKSKLLGALAALALSASVSQANIIEVNFTGTAYAIKTNLFGIPTFYAAGSGDQSFSAHFVFDTDAGTMTTGFETTCITCHHLTGGLVSAFIDFANFDGFGGGQGSFFISPSFLVWEDDFSFVIALGGGQSTHRIWASLTDLNGAGRYGGFQYGNCPTAAPELGPCGWPTSITSMTITGIPGPIVGAGLPGVLFAIGGLLAWWHRTKFCLGLKPQQ